MTWWTITSIIKWKLNSARIPNYVVNFFFSGWVCKVALCVFMCICSCGVLVCVCLCALMSVCCGILVCICLLLLLWRSCALIGVHLESTNVSLWGNHDTAILEEFGYTRRVWMGVWCVGVFEGKAFPGEWDLVWGWTSGCRVFFRMACSVVAHILVFFLIFGEFMQTSFCHFFSSSPCWF